MEETVMTVQKEKNAAVARKLLSGPFWSFDNFPRYYDPAFTMEFPSAPPGMPNYFCPWEAERCFEWLNRTVMSWQATLEEFYTTPDENQFWGVGVCGGDVFWGKTPGHFQSKFFVRVEFENGKVKFMKGWMDAVAFLLAANLEVPWIIKNTDDPRVDEWLANTPRRWQIDLKGGRREVKTAAELDMSEEAVKARIAYNVMENMCGVEREKYRENVTASPNMSGGGWFIPDYRPWDTLPREEYSVHTNNDARFFKTDAESETARKRQRAWVKLSSPWMYRDTRGRSYPTDDPFVYFIERFSKGPCLWAGNGFEQGHYHQQYLIVMKFDESGRGVCGWEILCPQYKYASTQITLPSFPYYG